MNDQNTCPSHILYDEKFKYMEQKISEMNTRLEGYDSIREVLVELKLITSQLVKATEQNDTILREHTLILSETAKSLRDLSKAQSEQDSKIDELDVKIEDTSNRGKIAFDDIWKNVLYALLGAVGTTIATMFLK